MLFLLKSEILKKFADLFNFCHDQCLSTVTKNCKKIFPILKKDSKLQYSNYRPIPVLLNIEKIIEKLL